MHPLAVLALAVAALFILLVWLRLNAFVALMTVAIGVGVLAADVPLAGAVTQATKRLGDAVAKIGIPIAMAAIIGQCLLASGGADKIIRRLTSLFSARNSSLSLLAGGYVLSIPVFVDTVFFLLIPLARAMSVRNGGRNFVLYALAITAGALATHVYVPPTPGPLVMAATLDVDLGMVALAGLFIAIPASLCGWLYSVWIDRRLNLPLREAAGAALGEMEQVAARSESELPGLTASLAPIIVPLALIGSNTVLEAAAPEHPLTAYSAFWGDPGFALLVAAVLAVLVYALRPGIARTDIARQVEEALRSAAMILLITSAGGAMGGMLVAAGVGESLGELVRGWSFPVLLLGFLVASIFKVGTGSATVGMITASSIIAPIIAADPPSFHPVYVVMAVGSGSLIGSWMNSSGFWLYRTMTGLDDIETLKTKTALMAVIGVSGFAFTCLAAALVPLR